MQGRISEGWLWQMSIVFHRPISVPSSSESGLTLSCYLALLHSMKSWWSCQSIFLVNVVRGISSQLSGRMQLTGRFSVLAYCTLSACPAPWALWPILNALARLFWQLHFLYALLKQNYAEKSEVGREDFTQRRIEGSLNSTPVKQQEGLMGGCGATSPLVNNPFLRVNSKGHTYGTTLRFNKISPIIKA